MFYSPADEMANKSREASNGSISWISSVDHDSKPVNEYPQCSDVNDELIQIAWADIGDQKLNESIQCSSNRQVKKDLQHPLITQSSLIFLLICKRSEKSHGRFRDF